MKIREKNNMNYVQEQIKDLDTDFKKIEMIFEIMFDMVIAKYKYNNLLDVDRMLEDMIEAGKNVSREDILKDVELKTEQIDRCILDCKKEFKNMDEKLVVKGSDFSKNEVIDFYLSAILTDYECWEVVLIKESLKELKEELKK